MRFGAAEGAVALFILVGFAVLAFIVWMLVDAIQRPPDEYPAPEQKTWWIVGLIVGLATSFPAIIVALAYYIIVRRPRGAPNRMTTSSPAPSAPGGWSPPAPAAPPPNPAAPPLQNCRNCGAKLIAGARFCHSCGAVV